MRSRTAFIGRPLGLLAAILLAAFAGFGPSALANDTPGNNGTVKIHEGAGENANGEVRNEPHVCTFHLHFYFADPEQAGTWEIHEWAPTGQKGTVVLSGTYDTHGDGEDRQPEEGVYTLPDGHYKLFWDGDLDTGKHDKMKVFWVECAPAGTVAATPSPTQNEQPAESQSAAPTASQQGAPGASESNLPIGGTSGETNSGIELGVGGVLGVSVTPPPTDTAQVQSPSQTSDWPLV